MLRGVLDVDARAGGHGPSRRRPVRAAFVSLTPRTSRAQLRGDQRRDAGHYNRSNRSLQTAVRTASLNSPPTQSTASTSGPLSLGSRNLHGLEKKGSALRQRLACPGARLPPLPHPRANKVR